MKTMLLALSMVVSVTVLAPSAWAGCDVVKDGAKAPFDGKSVAGVQVEKKSLIHLNKAFPALNVVEKAFKGEVQTCTSCSGQYVTCN